MRLFICLSLLHGAFAFWWWFSGSTQDKNQMPSGGEQGSPSTDLTQVFAPFEISVGEEKFLQEAKNYLQNLPMLDQCNMLYNCRDGSRESANTHVQESKKIINRLKTSCNKLSDEQLSKLSVNLLNCQSAVEGRKTYQCTDEMALSECTGPMDPDTWNSYHIISNRARAICYNMRQTQFRMKTEQTVNQLASSTLNNINLLKNLAAGQQKMQEVTEEAVSSLSANQNKLLSNQNSLKQKQAVIGGILNTNMKDLVKEKRLIAERHHQVEQYTKMINEQLSSLSDEIKAQDLAKKESEQEILKDLDSVKTKADEVLQRLGSAFDDMDNYQENLEDKQNKTLKNLEEIQETIVFMNDIIQKLYVTFNEQIPWLQNMFGGTVDRLTIITNLLGHVGFFLASFFLVLFVNAPGVTRVLMLVLVPSNYLMMLHDSEYQLNYLQMSWILTGSVPAYYVLRAIWQFINSLKTGKQVVIADKFSFRTPETTKARLEFKEMDSSYTPIATEKNFISTNPLATDDIIKNSSPIRNLKFFSYPDITESLSGSRKLIREVLNSSSPRLNTSIGGSRCCATTKSGAKCKNSAIGCTVTCRVHTPQKQY